MASVYIINLSQPLPGPLRASFCATFPCRLRGLTFRRSLSMNEGLLLVQKRESRLDTAIHMLFMWMDIAVVWLDAEKKIVGVQVARRWRPYYAPKAPAQYTLEIAKDWFYHFNIGDQVEFEEIIVD